VCGVESLPRSVGGFGLASGQCYSRSAESFDTLNASSERRSPAGRGSYLMIARSGSHLDAATPASIGCEFRGSLYHLRRELWFLDVEVCGAKVVRVGEG
jgi:hypothetical protein